MKVFSLAPATIRLMLLRSLLRYQLAVTISFLVFGVFLSTGPAPVNWIVGGTLLGFLFIGFFLVIFFNVRAQFRLLRSTRVEIDSGRISLRQGQREPHSLTPAQVSEIFETREGLLLHTAQPKLKMLIPRGLAGDGDAEIRSILSRWAPIDTHLIYGRRINWVLFWFSVFAGLMILMFANSLWIAVPLAVFLFFFGTYAERRLNSTYSVDPRITRSYSLAFSFLIVLIMMKTCLVLWTTFK